MTNKNGTAVPTAQELQTFLPVDSVNGVTKWVFIYIEHTPCTKNGWMNLSDNQSINQSINSNDQIDCKCEYECMVCERESECSNLECSKIRRKKVKRIVWIPKAIFSIINVQWVAGNSKTSHTPRSCLRKQIESKWKQAKNYGWERVREKVGK